MGATTNPCLPPVAPQQAASADETREACIAAMTELGMLYRRGVSEWHDFPRIRNAVNAYLNIALATH